MISRLAGLKYVGLTCCFMALAACSKKDQPNLDPINNAPPIGGGVGAGQAVPGSKADFATNVGDRVFFLQDQSTLTGEGSGILSKQAGWLKQYGQVTVQVEGHADERGTREYNIALSARRATAARNFLIQNGVPANRISSIAYGKERPVALCDAEQCWSQNRRAVTVITGGAQ